MKVRHALFFLFMLGFFEQQVSRLAWIGKRHPVK